MHYMSDYIPEDDTQLVQEIYRRFDESSRLTHSKAVRVEFLTTVRYIEKYLRAGMKILDIGAGAGEYSLYFAQKGYHVTAVELADANIQAFRQRIRPGQPLTLLQGNAMDLSMLGNEQYDIVLLLGPLYHLHKEEDRQKCIRQAKRNCKSGGKLFFSFISNDAVFLTEFIRRPDYFSVGDYFKESFKLYDFPFVFHTVDACRQMLLDGGIRILHEVASDGASELLEEKINEMPEEDYQQYLRYHAYICEKPECLGFSNHLLFVGERQQETATSG